MIQSIAGLAGATGALLVAPLVYRTLVSRPSLRKALDGFVLASIGLLVVMHLLPHAIENAGLTAGLAALFGLATPLLMERVQHVSTKRTHTWALVLALAALVVHAAIDGMALVAGDDAASSAQMAMAVVVHRLPVGVAIWWLVRPRFGARVAWGVIAIVCAATYVGFFMAGQLLQTQDAWTLALFQAFVAGMLMHVLFHVPGHHHGHSHDEHDHDRAEHDHAEHDHAEHDHAGHDHADHDRADHDRADHDRADHDHADHDHASPGAPDADTLVATASCSEGGCGTSACGDTATDGEGDDTNEEWAWAETLGALCGVALVVATPRLLGPTPGHDHAAHAAHAAEHGFGERFVELALESAPALLLGFLLAGLVSVMLPRASFAWLRAGRPFAQTLKGVAFGLPLPICSCGVVPMYQSLVRRGAAPAAAMAFLVATPEIGIEAIVLSIPFLGVELTIIRLVAAALVALSVGWLVGRSIPSLAPSGVEEVERAPSALSARLLAALRFGLVDIVNETAAWLLVGLAIAAAIEPAGLSSVLAGVPPVLEVAAFALLGLPIYVCASGATPLAAAMILAGASPGAALAFLIAGPATNVTTYGVLAQLHGPRRAIAFGATVFGAAVLLGVLVDLLFGGLTIPAADPSHAISGSLLAWVCLAILGMAFGATILRQGPRAFLATVVSFGDDEHTHI